MYQYEISSTLMTRQPPLPHAVRLCLIALVYISRTSINILGAVTSLHILLTKPAKGITMFQFVPQDSL